MKMVHFKQLLVVVQLSIFVNRALLNLIQFYFDQIMSKGLQDLYQHLIS